MKKIATVLLITFLLYNYTLAQKKAITEEGKEVLLFENGTWKYTEDEEGEIEEVVEIPVNNKNFLKDEKASFLLKSTKNEIGYWLNPKKWTFKKAQKNEDAEYDLQYKDGDAYAMIISEGMEIPLETLKDIAINNAKEVSADVSISKQEYRYVNGLKILYMELDGSIKGMKFSYLGYYYSNESGTTQFVCFTAQNLKEKYKEEIVTLLNGIVEY
ncbi:MAG: hypothetical protein IPK18_06160 [Sphingobacteriales bacterium]|nr:MAG: hypothetical protein IPK18_06160 [Sphingobacteriales bacterium]